ncbi:hypothetical protein RJ640_029013 [Escallonia rubra]|uniref:Uncharacterized protein n=1 Tax=Escallonia rubra TaxID=112253 RepID=A0AA88SA86_9ASTE|nr:hypothetical protein RJ640_029013 [Escallonia rubra]
MSQQKLDSRRQQNTAVCVKRALLAASPASYYGGYVGVAEMNEKRDERAILKSIYILRRAPKRFLGQLSSLIHRSNALGSSHGGKSQNVVVNFITSTHSPLSPASSHTERKSAEPRPDL